MFYWTKSCMVQGGNKRKQDNPPLSNLLFLPADAQRKVSRKSMSKGSFRRVLAFETARNRILKHVIKVQEFLPWQALKRWFLWHGMLKNTETSSKKSHRNKKTWNMMHMQNPCHEKPLRKRPSPLRGINCAWNMQQKERELTWKILVYVFFTQHLYNVQNENRTRFIHNQPL